MERKGFTLVELLVVISIIALLMAILMPVLSKVKAIANQMVCGTNLSGIGKGMMLYAGDYDDDYPIAGGRESEWAVGGSIGTTEWYEETEEDAFPNGTATVTASLYYLVKYADMTPAQFVCRGDIGTDEFKLSDYPTVVNANPDLELADLWDFGTSPGKCCSYSYHLPFLGNTSPGQAFPISPQSSPSAPVAADRNPYFDINATSYIPPDPPEVEPAWENDRYYDPDKTGNSASHQRNGQNVMFNDVHVDFERYPNVGINNDNIWKSWLSATTPDAEEMQVGGQISGSPGEDAPQSNKDALLVAETN